MKKACVLPIILIFASGAPAATDPQAELSRLRAFTSEQKARRDQEAQRRKGVDTLRQQRAKAKAEMDAAAKAHSQKRALEKKRKDESVSLTPEHVRHLRSRLQDLENLESGRKEYVRGRDEARKVLKQRPISEEYELGLVPEPERIDWRKRKPLISGSGSAGFSGGMDSGPQTPTFSEPNTTIDNSPAPPPPPSYDPAIDDSMAPPPVFEDEY